MHDRILRAARSRFERRGVAGTKIDEICAAADVAQKTFFNHFPTKQDLVREIASALLDELVAILEETRRTAASTPQRLERLFARIAAETEAAGPMRRELMVDVIRLVHDERAEAEPSRRLHASFGALIRDGIRAGDVTRAHPLPVLTDAVVGVFYAIMLNWLGIDGYPMRARAIGVARLLGDVLGADRTARS